MKHAIVSVLFLTACESMVIEDLTYDVSDEAVAASTAEAPLVLVSSREGAVAAFCDGGGRVVETHSEAFGCIPDEEEGEEFSVSAWVVDMPEAWDAETVCAIAEAPLGFPVEDLREKDDGDPFAETTARWKKVPICGGDLAARLTL